MDMLSAIDVAELRGCSAKYVKTLCQKGELECTVSMNEKNRPKYMIPLAALDSDLQTRYHRLKQGVTPAPLPPKASPSTQAKPLDAYTLAEREEIQLWIDVVQEWQSYRNRADAQSKANIDERFVAFQRLERPELTLSIPILYRKWAALREDDYNGLLDKRGKWRLGKRETPVDIFKLFETYYLDESKYPIEKCIEYTQGYLQKHRPDLVAQMPSYSTFRRYAKAIPYVIMVLGRLGESAYYELCSPYIRREYESIASNEWWVADTHTFDIISKAKNGNTHRIYLNAYMDARSGIFTGWCVTNASNSDASLYALKRGIERCGIPYNIYVDNGREYLTTDIGGRGHRAKKVLANGEKPFEPPGVYHRLGIKMTNAIVHNPHAKIIERRFRDVKDHISRLFLTYCGGTVVEKPDRLKHVLKTDKKAKKVPPVDDKLTTIACEKVVRDEVLEQIVDKVLSGYMNYQAYNGSVTEDVGKRRIDVFHERLNGHQRKAEPEELVLMLLRTSKPQMVDRPGVFVKIAGKKIYFWSHELMTYQRQQVYVRFDPDNLLTARVYNAETHQFILEVPRANALEAKYGDTKEKISEGVSQIRHARKIQKQALEQRRIPLADEDSALMLVLEEAERNLQNPAQMPRATTIDWVRPDETPMRQAVGATINITTMAQNAERYQKMKEDSQ